MVLAKQLGLAYECLSAIGNSLEVDRMMNEMLCVFSKKTGAISAAFYAHRDDKKPWTQIGKDISFEFDRSDMEDQIYMAHHDNLHTIIMPLEHGFLRFDYKSNKGLEETAKMLGDFQIKINLALDVCTDIEKLDSIHVGVHFNHKDSKEKVKIIFEDKEQAEDMQKKAQIASKIKSEFIANINHEVRTPLNSILGFVDLLREENIKGKSLEYVNIIDSSSQNLLYIMEDILEFSHLDKDKLYIEKRDFETQKEFQVITHLFKTKCSLKSISLTLSLSTALPKYINTDPYRIKQILTNLISNAVKYSDKGKIIFIDVNYKNDSLYISVRDEGVGIQEDKLKDIFESFSQEDNSAAKKHEGLGIGLAVSNKLIELLGGKLEAKSKVGVGSEFYFSLPAPMSKKPELKNRTIKDITFEGKKILLVEDSKANQVFMKIVLKKLKIEFDIANDGLEAIEAFKHNRYDLILMDENMPNLNGTEATKEILKIERKEHLKHTIIVALTANAHHDDRKKFLDAGMDEYLTKPLDRTKFNKVLNSFFRHKRESSAS